MDMWLCKYTTLQGMRAYTHKDTKQAGLGVHAFNPSTREEEADRDFQEFETSLIYFSKFQDSQYSVEKPFLEKKRQEKRTEKRYKEEERDCWKVGERGREGSKQ